jgi:hypothetical protein
VDVKVYAGTDNEACRAALRDLPSDYRAIRALRS